MTVHLTKHLTPEIAKKALEILENPETRTRKTLARNAANKPVWVLDPDACKWCGIGAIIKAGATVTHEGDVYFAPAVLELAEILSGEEEPCAVWRDNDWNDARLIIAALREIAGRS